MKIEKLKCLIARLLGGVLFAGTLSGCATTEAPVEALVKQLPLDTLMTQASTAFVSGQSEKASESFKAAAMAYPTDKAPWVRLAQMNFDSANYGEAIVHALEALQRDPTDKVAQSLIAVSGLRLSTKALADLRSQNELSGTVRSEAQDLAKVLRENIGEAVLVPPQKSPVVVKAPQRIVVKPPKQAELRQPATSAPEARGGSNPFGALR